MPSTLELTPALLDSELKMLELHRLIKGGGGDSSEADALRDQMDAPWYQMSVEQRDVIGDLSADLYQITQEERYVAVSDPLLLDAVKDMFSGAVRDGDWLRVINILRRRPRSAPNGPVASLRAHAYQKVGLRAAGHEFEEFARQCGSPIIQDGDEVNRLKDAIWAAEVAPTKLAVAQ